MKMIMIMTLGAVLFTVLAAPAYAQGGAQPEPPPPAGGQIEPAPPVTTEDVLDVPQMAVQPAREGSIARLIFTSGIEEREPVDQLTSISAPDATIYFFTELKDLDGQTVKHRWLYKGEVVAEVAFNVGGSRWRVWSSKNLLPEQLGTWTVEVVNGSGKVIGSSSIEHQAPAEKPPVPLAAEPTTGVAVQP